MLHGSLNIDDNNFRLKITPLLLVLITWCGVINAQLGSGSSQDPGHGEYLSVNGVRFSCPKGFDTARQTKTAQVIYVPHHEYDLGMFVAVPNKTIEVDYQKEISILMASYVLPSGKSPYSWKRKDAYGKVSKFETGNGEFQGFDGKRRVMVTFRQITVKDKTALVGYAFELGGGDEAKKLFDENLTGDSMPGWFAQAHMIASITGEKYEEINPGSYFKTTPAPRKP